MSPAKSTGFFTFASGDRFGRPPPVRCMADSARSAAPHLGSTATARRIESLLAAARHGDRAALGQLFDAARQQLLDAASRGLPPALRGRVGPSDVVQETAIDMQRDFERFSGSTTEELFAWLRTILNHNLIDTVRHHGLAAKRSPRREVRLGDSRAGHGALSLIGTTIAPDASAIRKEDAANLHRTLTRLPEDYRTVIWLRYWRGMSFEEIATQMQRSSAATRKLWHRGIRRLNAELKAECSQSIAGPCRDDAATDPGDSGESVSLTHP